MNGNILLKNCKISNGCGTYYGIKDILIKDGIITEIRGGIAAGADFEIYNAESRFAVPSFIDMHCHLRDPGFEYKEDIESGTLAAFYGGYSSVVCMPNTNPVADNPATLDYIIRKAKNKGHCKVFPTASITIGQKGRELCDFFTLAECGAVGFTDDGKPVTDAGVMRRAMQLCAEHDLLIITHPEEPAMSESGVMNESAAADHLGVKGIPCLAEDLAIARDILIAEDTGCRLHVAHISTKTGARLVREAKMRGVKITCETCPHYFSFTDEDVILYGGNAKMNPPLRSQADVQAIIEALKDGTIDCISTDHAPHSEAEKNCGLKSALNGITGLQTAFAAGVTNLVMKNHIGINKLIDLMSVNPAKILGIGSEIEPGNKADINIIDPYKNFIFTKDMIKSKSFNTPFIGQSLYGVIEYRCRSLIGKFDKS